MSQCLICVGVRHFYDTYTSRVGIGRKVSEKSNKFHTKNDFFSLRRYSLNQYLTLKHHMSENIFKQMFQKEFVFFQYSLYNYWLNFRHV
jgi:hypothetical protein